MNNIRLSPHQCKGFLLPWFSATDVAICCYRLLKLCAPIGACWSRAYGIRAAGDGRVRSRIGLEHEDTRSQVGDNWAHCKLSDPASDQFLLLLTLSAEPDELLQYTCRDWLCPLVGARTCQKWWSFKIGVCLSSMSVLMTARSRTRHKAMWDSAKSFVVRFSNIVI